MWAIKIDSKHSGASHSTPGIIWVSKDLGDYVRKRDRKLFSLKRDAAMECDIDGGEVVVKVGG